jgi:3-oxoadipate enol-lactonase
MIAEAYVTLDGRRVRYLAAGSGWPVVFLHAFPLNADMWRPQLARVPEGFRFVAPDLPGARPSLDAAARDVMAMLDELRIDSAVIAGLSMGGYLAFALYRLAPERFDGLVLADTRPQADTADGRAGRLAMIDLVKRGGAAAVADQMLPKLLGETTRRERPSVVSDVRRLIEATSTETMTAMIQAMLDRPDSTNDVRRVTCPALVLAGEEDAITPPADASAMSRLIPRSLNVVLPRAGHLSNMEAPDDFSLALADFLTARM